MHVLSCVEGAEPRFVAAAGTFASVLHRLRPGWKLRLSIFHDSRRGGPRERFAASFDPRRVELEWLEPDWTRFREFGPTPGDVPAAALRMFATDYLLDQERVVWIDPHILFQRDAVELWETPLKPEHYCLAVQDAAAPLFDGATHPRLRGRARPELNQAVPDCRRLGFQGTEPYFNGGVQVLNLSAWRRDDVADALQGLYFEQQGGMHWGAQCFMNQCFVGRWGRLDSRWNRQIQALHPELRDARLMEDEEYLRYLSDPWTTHYAPDYGPWSVPGCPDEVEFQAAIDRTSWAGWRPPAGPFRLRRWVQVRAQSIRRRLSRAYAKLFGRTR